MNSYSCWVLGVLESGIFGEIAHIRYQGFWVHWKAEIWICYCYMLKLMIFSNRRGLWGFSQSHFGGRGTLNKVQRKGEERKRKKRRRRETDKYCVSYFWLRVWKFSAPPKVAWKICAQCGNTTYTSSVLMTRERH